MSAICIIQCTLHMYIYCCRTNETPRFHLNKMNDSIRNVRVVCAITGPPCTMHKVRNRKLKWEEKWKHANNNNNNNETEKFTKPAITFIEHSVLELQNIWNIWKQQYSRNEFHNTISFEHWSEYGIPNAIHIQFHRNVFPTLKPADFSVCIVEWRLPCAISNIFLARVRRVMTLQERKQNQAVCQYMTTCPMSDVFGIPS